MAPVADARRHAGGVVGFLAGAAVGGTLLWTVGYYAFVSPTQTRLLAPLYLLSLLAFPFGLIAPSTLVWYFGRNLEGLRRGALLLVGYALMVVFVGALAYFGIPQRLGIDTAIEAIAFLDAVTGVALGGILGRELVARVGT